MINNRSPATGIKDRCEAIARSRWFLPLLCLGLGVVILAVAFFRWRG
jgi:hypothetical protein